MLPVFLLAVFWLPGAWAVSLPPLQGDVSGQLRLHGFGNAPPLDWRVQSQPGNKGDILVHITATAPGLAFLLELQVPANGDVIHWRILNGEVELNRWWRPVTTRIGITGLPDDFMVAAPLHLSGQGTLRGTQASGIVRATVDEGTAGSLTQNWSLTGLTVRAQLALTPEGPLVQTLQLRATEGQAMGVALNNLVLEALGVERQRLAINVVSVDALGGRLALRPFTLDPAKIEIATTADVEGLALEALAGFVPQALREARGQMSGHMAVRWSAKSGTQPGGGLLTVEPASSASLRLAAAPGFLTQHTTERIQWLPDLFGAMARWLAVENPAFDTLRRIELGDMPLQVEKLRVSLYPDGADGARSALVEIVARPATDTAVGQVAFTLNVAGPLEKVLRLGSDERVKLNIGAKP